MKLGEQLALDIWKEFGVHLGNLMKVILFTYAPQAIILGGGIVSAFSLFEESMKGAMHEFPYDVISNKVKVMPSHLKDASLLGASALLEE